MIRPKKNRKRIKSGLENASAKGPIQFNWRRHWSKKVVPYLHEKLVQASLDLGMTILDPAWKHGDGPCDYGACDGNRIVKGELSWYQPLNRCHYIAFFSMAIGVLNYPNLDWRFVSGDVHTVRVGYGPDGKPRVVMDILLFDHFTAEESIIHTRKEIEKLKTSDEIRNKWAKFYQIFETELVPKLKARARELQQARKDGQNRDSLWEVR